MARKRENFRETEARLIACAGGMRYNASTIWKIIFESFLGGDGKSVFQRGKEEMKKQAREERLLRQLGVGYSYLGFQYTIAALEIVRKDPQLFGYIEKGVYAPVSEQFETSGLHVQRNISTMIRVIWNAGNREFLTEIAGRPLEARPKCREFLEILAAHLDKPEAIRDEDA